MASEPTDLIRAVDAALAQEAADEGGPIVDDPAALVRRLRDALEAERNATKQERNLCDHHHAGIATYADGLVTELGETKAALAEANATIEKLTPRRVETAAELDALPVGAILRDHEGDAWQKDDDGQLMCAGIRAIDNAWQDQYIPLTVLWLPEVSS